MRLNKLIIILSAALFLNKLQSQNDSLVSLIRNPSSPDTVKLEAMYNLGAGLLYNNPDSTLLLSNQIIQLAVKNKFFKWEAYGYNIKGAYYYIKSDFEPAINCHEHALVIRRNAKDKFAIASSLNNLGIIYQVLANYTKSLEYFLESTRIYEEIHSKDGLALAYTNIGIAYGNLGDRKRELDYAFKSLAIDKEINDEPGIAGDLSVVASSYYHLHQYDSALIYETKSLEINKKLGNKTAIMGNMTNLALDYIEKGDYVNALDNYKLGIIMARELESREIEAICLIGTGNIYDKQKKYRDAISFAKQGYDIAHNAGLMKLEREAASLISDSYKASGQPGLALPYFERYIVLRDSMNNEEISKSTYRLELKSSYEKKETAARLEQARKDAAAEEEKKVQRKITILISFVLVISLIAGVIILRSLRLNKKKNKIISEQKSEVEKQKHLIEEKQKEILDSINYAKRIQQTLLPNQKYIAKSLERLNKR